MIRASDWVAFHADRTPEKIALIDEASGRQFSYGTLHERVENLAGYLRREWHVEKGDVLAILAKNSTDYFEFQFAFGRAHVAAQLALGRTGTRVHPQRLGG
jgi:fatty-acyl-CoA synthase